MSDQTIREMKDMMDIQHLRTLYSLLLDSNDLDGLVRIFTQDATCDFGAGEFTGHAALKEVFAAAHREYDKRSKGAFPFLHVTANHWIELTGENSARGRCYLMDYVTGDARPDPLLLLGHYADEYRKVDGRWLFQRCRLNYIWPDWNVA